jgi:hypothetical protein
LKGVKCTKRTLNSSATVVKSAMEEGRKVIDAIVVN